jgi:hypothetical protein
MSSSGTPIAGTDRHEDDHAPSASLVPATAHALAIGDERVRSLLFLQQLTLDMLNQNMLLLLPNLNDLQISSRLPLSKHLLWSGKSFRSNHRPLSFLLNH